MNIGFDAKRAFFNRTGLGNYSRNLITALHQHFPQNKYQLFSPQPKAKHLFPQFEVWNNAQLIAPKGLWPATLWRSFGIPSALKQNETNIYHGLSAELPFGHKPEGSKYIVSIHDLIFMRFPELYNAMDRKIYYRKTKYACEKADRIIAISEQTKRDIVSFLSIEASKIDVVYQNCDAVFAQEIPDAKKQLIRGKYNLPEQYLLSVGTLEKRKNALIILKSLLHLPKDIHVVLVGKSTPYQAELDDFIQSNDLSERVVMLHGLPFEDLPALYQSSKIFIYPSIFEGFGIPIIEALNAQVPVIAATGSCLEEAGGPDSLYFNPEDAPSLAQHILSLWNDEAKRSLQIASGVVYANRFSASNFAEETMKVYQKII